VGASIGGRQPDGRCSDPQRVATGAPARRRETARDGQTAVLQAARVLLRYMRGAGPPRFRSSSGRRRVAPACYLSTTMICRMLTWPWTSGGSSRDTREKSGWLLTCACCDWAPNASKRTRLPSVSPTSAGYRRTVTWTRRLQLAHSFQWSGTRQAIAVLLRICKKPNIPTSDIRTRERSAPLAALKESAQTRGDC